MIFEILQTKKTSTDIQTFFLLASGFIYAYMAILYLLSAYVESNYILLIFLLSQIILQSMFFTKQKAPAEASAFYQNDEFNLHHYE